MHSTSTIRDIQAFAVLNDYERALSIGAYEYAERVRKANPDLDKDLASLYKAHISKDAQA